MRLSDHIKHSRGRGAELSAALKIPPSYLSQLASGHRSPSPSLSVQIERETAGAVRRWDLRPDDWHRIWPELIGAAGAPAIPAEAEDA